MKRILLTCLLLIFGSGAALAQLEAKAVFSDWTYYQLEDSGATKCFVVTQPLDSEPKNVKRGPILFFITNFPKENVKEEVSIVIGYPFAPNNIVKVSVDGKNYDFFTKDEIAWIKNEGEQTSLVQAVRRGAKMTVTGKSARGTTTVDNFSLKGVTAALNEMKKSCK